MNIEQERAAFEAWGNERFKCGFHPETWDGATEYEHEGTQMAWEAWQASAASRHDQQRTVKVPDELPIAPLEKVKDIYLMHGTDITAVADWAVNGFSRGFNACRAEVLRMNGGE